MTGPYANAAQTYRAAGWLGVLPVKGKWPPPVGWTGADAPYPSGADIWEWCEQVGHMNVALRLPLDVIGIDVDHYGDKLGNQTLAIAEQAWGPLPATWISTSREDGISGIRMLRKPLGLSWPGELKGGGVELIQHRHRYVMAWPSVHPEGRIYRWIRPDGTLADEGEVPRPDDLPDLPGAWIAGLTGGREAAEIARADLGDEEAMRWLAQHGGGAPCAAMTTVIDRAKADLSSGQSSRHEAALRSVARVALMATEGHAGAAYAVNAVAFEFQRATGDDPTRKSELGRIITGAIRIAAAQTLEDGDPCAGNLLTLKPSPLKAAPVEFGAPLVAPSTDATARALEPAPAEHPSPEVRERTSWWPIDLEPYWSGELIETPPQVLRRSDGEATCYLGKVNGIIGASESGKSWLAMLATVQELEAGNHVAYLDFEDSAGGVINRLKKFGLNKDARRRFHYIGPDEAPGAGQMADLAEVCEKFAPRLIVFDGFNAAMALSGLDLMSNTDATRFHQGLLRPFVREDRAIIYIDHVPKSKLNDSAGAIGAQAKRAMTSGTTIRVEKRDSFGPGFTGYLDLTIDKDRAGRVVAIAKDAKRLGTAVIDGDDDHIAVRIDPAEDKPSDKAKDKRNSGLLYAISAALEDAESGLSRNAIYTLVGGNETTCMGHIDLLLAEGFVEETKGARGARVTRLVRKYTEGLTLTTPTSSTSSTSSDLLRPPPAEEVKSSPPLPPPPPHPFRGGGGEEVLESVPDQVKKPSTSSNRDEFQEAGRALFERYVSGGDS